MKSRLPFQAYNVLIEEEDLPNLYIVPTGDWYLDTGRSFRLVDTPGNLRPGRGASPALGLGPIEHHANVQAKAQYMSTHGTASDEVLILISSAAAGPYTIIDGTHRAVVLHTDHMKIPNMPWKGILARDPLVAQSRWSIDSAQAQLSIAQFGTLASTGALW
jgi:hypothetical protein